MADRYLLPPELGGGECDLVWRKGVDDQGVEVSKVRIVTDAGMVEVVIPSALLTPVAPPLDEPPLWSVVLVPDGHNGVVYRRYAPGWGVPDADDDDDLDEWAALCRNVNGLPVRLIPEPTEDALRAYFNSVDVVCSLYDELDVKALLAWLRGDR